MSINTTSTNTTTITLTNVQEELIGRHQFYLHKYKLSGLSELMAFMAGFSVVSIAELQVDHDDNEWLLAGYALTTSLLVSISTFVIMVNCWIMPHLQCNNDDELNFDTPISIKSTMNNTSSIVRRINRLRLNNETRHFIQIAWILSSTVSVFLFTINVIILGWIKFKPYKYATYASTLILGISLLILLYFGIMFRRRLYKTNFLFNENNNIDDDDDNEYEYEYKNNIIHHHHHHQQQQQQQYFYNDLNKNYTNKSSKIISV